MAARLIAFLGGIFVGPLKSLGAWLVSVLVEIGFKKIMELIEDWKQARADQKVIAEEKKKMAASVEEYRAVLKASREERRKRALGVLNSPNNPQP